MANLNNKDLLAQLNPNSAEAKAIERLSNIDSELDRFITTVEIGQEIDVESLNERLSSQEHRTQNKCNRAATSPKNASTTPKN
jgi:hypothetical protein